MLKHCPDYLEDFTELQNMAYAQRLIYTGTEIKVLSMRSRATFYSSSDEWEEVLDIDYSNNWKEKTYRMLRRYEYISSEEYEALVGCWIDGAFELTVDYENLAVLIRTTEKIYNINKYAAALRNIFPCNMTFGIEYVTAL